MEKLIEKTNRLLEEIDKLSQVKRIRQLNKIISCDIELRELIDNYNYNIL